MEKWVVAMSDGQNTLPYKIKHTSFAGCCGYVAGDGEIYCLFDSQREMDEGWARLRKNGHSSSRLGKKIIPEGVKIYEPKNEKSDRTVKR